MEIQHGGPEGHDKDFKPSKDKQKLKKWSEKGRDVADLTKEAKTEAAPEQRRKTSEIAKDAVTTEPVKSGKPEKLSKEFQHLPESDLPEDVKMKKDPVPQDKPTTPKPLEGDLRRSLMVNRELASAIMKDQAISLSLRRKILTLIGEFKSDEKASAQLIKAAAGGDLDQVKSLELLSHPRAASSAEKFVSDFNATGNAELLQALLSHGPEGLSVARKLIELGLDIDSKDPEGNTPLINAALEGQEAIALGLVGLGADVNAANIDGLTPLHLALWNKHSHLAIALMNVPSTDIDKVSTLRRYTPLHLAIYKGQVEAVKEILSKAKKKLAPHPDGNDKLFLRAITTGQLEIVKLMAQHVIVHSDLTVIGETELLHALLPHGPEGLSVARKLIKLGLDIDSKDPEGNTPLIDAARKGQEAIALGLVELGADVNAANIEGLTPLHLALWNKHSHLAIALMNVPSTDIDKVSTLRRYTPLHLAIYKGQVEAVKEILGKAKKKLAPHPDGNVNLFRNAILTGQLEIAKLIAQHLQFSIDPVHGEKGKGELFFLSYIMPGAKEEVFQILKDRMGEAVFTPLEQRIQAVMRRVDLAHMLHTKGLEEGWSTLEKAAVVKSTGFSPQSKEDKVKIEGAARERWLSIMARGLRNYSKRNPNVLSAESANRISSVLERRAKAGERHYSATLKEDMQMILDGEPVLLKSGFDEHQSITLIWGDFIVRADMAKGDSEGFMVRRWQPPNPDDKNYDDACNTLSKVLEKNVKCIKGSGQKYLNFWLNAAPQKLGYQKDDLTDLMEKSSPLFRQLVGNCSWACSEGGLLGLMLIDAVRNIDNPEARPGIVEATVKAYQQVIFDMQLDAMENMLTAAEDPNKVYKPDHRLIQDGFRMLYHFRDNSKWARMDESREESQRLLERITDMEDRYSDLVSTESHLLRASWISVRKGLSPLPKTLPSHVRRYGAESLPQAMSTV